MFGHPASSQTVCSPSRRTSDLSAVYSGPVLSRVLIHSGLRSIGTWLLRTSSRSSLRPAGPIGEPEAVVGAAVSVMISTVPRTHDRPGPARGPARGGRPIGSRRVGGLALGAGGRGAGRGLVAGVAVGHLLRLLPEVGLGGRAVARGGLGVGDGLVAGCAGH